MRTSWPSKDPAEVLVVTFDFSSEVDSGESISAAQVYAEVVFGTDPIPTAVLSGSPSVAGGAVLQAVNGGVDGAVYGVRCVATLSPTGRVLVLAANLPVRTA